MMQIILADERVHLNRGDGVPACRGLVYFETDDMLDIFPDSVQDIMPHMCGNCKRTGAFRSELEEIQ